jgi:hypothetical protein
LVVKSLGPGSSGGVAKNDTISRHLMNFEHGFSTDLSTIAVAGRAIGPAGHA